ncbi:unnamed protein product [Malus baccata var. baccata]
MATTYMQKTVTRPFDAAYDSHSFFQQSFFTKASNLLVMKAKLKRKTKLERKKDPTHVFASLLMIMTQ